MKNRKLHFPILLLSVLISVVGAYFLLFYPGYLQNRTLSECILTMGFKALKCGRALYLVAVLVGAVLSFINLQRYHLNGGTHRKTVIGSVVFFVAFFYRNSHSYSASSYVQLAVLSLLCGVYCGIATPLLLVFVKDMRSKVYPILSIDYFSSLKTIWDKNKVPLISAVISGFLAYAWFFTNKILNHDEIDCLFNKGATVDSGRWGLEVMRAIFPDYSMPWLWGVITLFILAVSCCIIVNTFQIRNTFLRVIIPAVIITFPAQTGTMVYMYTTTSYACDFLLSVIVVYLLYTKDRKNIKAVLIAVSLEILALSIYQAYVTVVSSLLVVLCMIDLYKGNKTIRKVLTDSLYYISFLAVSLALYYGLNTIIMYFYNVTYNYWAVRAFDTSEGIPDRIIDAYIYFYKVFDAYAFGIVTSGVSKIAHFVLLLFILIQGSLSFSKERKKEKWMFAGYAAVLLPLSVNGLFLLVGKECVHVLTLYSYISLYVLAAVLAEEMIKKQQYNMKHNVICNAVALVITVIVSGNVLFANEVGLEQYIEYENTYSIYHSVITQIQSLPEFTEEKKIAFVGTVPDGEYRKEFKEIEGFPALSSFRNAKSIKEFIKYYLGYDLQYATSEEVNRIRDTEEFKKMETYPYNGCIGSIDDIITVKFSD